MTNTNKRIGALLLAILMVLSLALTGCARRPSDNEGTRDKGRAEQSENVEKVAEKEEKQEKKPATQEMSSKEVAQFLQSRVVKVDTDGGHGSGFFIDDEGTVVTNYHVIDGAESIEIYLSDGARYDIENIVDFNPYYDIAVLKVDIQGNDYLELADDFVQGEDVYVLGSPKNMDASFTSGTLSSTKRKLGLMDCIQTDAAINNGNSGGPAVNNKGEVLGICSYVRTDAANMGFAIKMSALDTMDMDKNFSVNRYREWYNKETGRSYLSTEDGRTFSYTYVHTYTTVTGVQCEASTDDFDDYEDGYSIMYKYYMYEYDVENYDKYCDYLNSIGFEYDSAEREMGYDTVYYYNEFEGYAMALMVDTVDNILVVSCPLY